jgi:Tfp pilus assembly protein PilN
MKLRLNIATAPLENNRPFIAGAVLIGAIALIALFVLSRETYVTWQSNLQLRTETAQLEHRINADEAQQQQLDAYFKRPDIQQVLQRADFLNSLIGERSFPWTKIFMDLENTLPPGVRVVSIAPKLVNGKAEVTMVIGAESDQSKIQFLQALEKSKNFSEVAESDERVSETPGDLDRVTVRLTFLYATTA